MLCWLFWRHMAFRCLIAYKLRTWAWGLVGVEVERWALVGFWRRWVWESLVVAVDEWGALCSSRPELRLRRWRLVGPGRDGRSRKQARIVGLAVRWCVSVLPCCGRTAGCRRPGAGSCSRRRTAWLGTGRRTRSSWSRTRMASELLGSGKGKRP